MATQGDATPPAAQSRLLFWSKPLPSRSNESNTNMHHMIVTSNHYLCHAIVSIVKSYRRMHHVTVHIAQPAIRAAERLAHLDRPFTEALLNLALLLLHAWQKFYMSLARPFSRIRTSTCICRYGFHRSRVQHRG
jgi:hypothetical protein